MLRVKGAGLSTWQMLGLLGLVSVLVSVSLVSVLVSVSVSVFVSVCRC